MYLTDFRENTLQDVITKLEPELFDRDRADGAGLSSAGTAGRCSNTAQMNQAVFAFRRYEDASLRYTGIPSHDGLTHYGLYDTVVAKDQCYSFNSLRRLPVAIGPLLPKNHSWRKASIGSMRAARRAGK
ncbi:MAG: hypothetical protein R3E55_02905 [Burkholderiaceae bacterium]